MSFQAMAWAWQRGLPPLEKLVLIYLADSYHPSSAPCPVDVDRLAEFCSITTKEAKVALSDLERRALIQAAGDRYWLALPDEVPEPVSKSDPPAVLYAIRCAGLVKIGITKNLQGRVSAIQTSNPQPVELVHSRSASWSVVKRWERLCHDAFAGSHMTGEWFNVDERDVVNLVESLEVHCE